MELVKPIVKGVEDNFYYYIYENCIACGKCYRVCPAKAIEKTDDGYQVISEKCIDCGTCAYNCPVGAIKPI